jgi:hypothetical protein
MTMKKILITGLRADMDETGVRTFLERFGPVSQVEIIREGNADQPVALAGMDIDEGAAAYLVFYLTDYWHEGAMLSARLLHH